MSSASDFRAMLPSSTSFMRSNGIFTLYVKYDWIDCFSFFKLPSFSAQLFWMSSVSRVMSKVSLELNVGYTVLRSSNNRMPSESSVKVVQVFERLFKFS